MAVRRNVQLSEPISFLAFSVFSSTGRLFQRLDKLLFVPEGADVVLLLGVDQARALDRLVIATGLLPVEQVNHVMFGYAEGGRPPLWPSSL